MSFCKLLFSKITKCEDSLFLDIIGYDHIKRLLKLALDSDSVVHILLVGPSALAKTMFLTSLMHQLKSSYFTDGTNSSKAGMIDYLFENRPRYLLVDEIDKMAPKDQAVLLNLMEIGIVTETKYGKTRSAQMKTSVFVTSNNIKKLLLPLHSRFFIADVIADAVWNKSKDIRDCVKIGAMAKTVSDIEFIVDKFFRAKPIE